MRKMQWLDGEGSFTGYAGKFHTDVDVWAALRGLRQYRGSSHSLQSDDAQGSEKQKACIACGATDCLTSSGSIAGSRPTAFRFHYGLPVQRDVGITCLRRQFGDGN